MSVLDLHTERVVEIRRTLGVIVAQQAELVANYRAELDVPYIVKHKDRNWLAFGPAIVVQFSTEDLFGDGVIIRVTVRRTQVRSYQGDLLKYPEGYVLKKEYLDNKVIHEKPGTTTRMTMQEALEYAERDAKAKGVIDRLNASLMTRSEALVRLGLEHPTDDVIQSDDDNPEDVKW